LQRRGGGPALCRKAMETRFRFKRFAEAS